MTKNIIDYANDLVRLHDDSTTTLDKIKTVVNDIQTLCDVDNTLKNCMGSVGFDTNYIYASVTTHLEKLLTVKNLRSAKTACLYIAYAIDRTSCCSSKFKDKNYSGSVVTCLP